MNLDPKEAAYQKRVGANIKRAREAYGLSQVELARLVGVHEVSVSRWETGTYFPRFVELFRVAQVLHTDPAYLTMDAEAGTDNVAAEIRNNRKGIMAAVLEEIKGLPPEEQRELAIQILEKKLRS